MSNSKLSVVLCTHNGEAYLREQLASLLAQSRRPDQIVVGDDASTDGSWRLIEDFAEEAASRGIEIRLVQRLSNVGLVQNFSDTMMKADGDLVFLCDQDDVWHSDKLSAMEDRFVSEPKLLMLWSNARLVDSMGLAKHGSLFEALELRNDEISAIAHGSAFSVLQRRSMATGATAALRRKALTFALPVGEGWIHDEWLAIVLSAIGRVGVSEKLLIDYRQHARNQVGMRKRSAADKWRTLVGSWRAQFERELIRLDSLDRHLRYFDGWVMPGVLALLAARREYLQRRIAIGRSPRWLRLKAIYREAALGNYQRFGTGYRSMLRDLLRHD